MQREVSSWSDHPVTSEYNNLMMLTDCLMMYDQKGGVRMHKIENMKGNFYKHEVSIIESYHSSN